MNTERYSIRKSKHTSLYDVFRSGFVPMYCQSFETKEQCRDFIKNQKKMYKEMYKD